jgi:hypothetical protein
MVKEGNVGVRNGRRLGREAESEKGEREGPFYHLIRSMACEASLLHQPCAGLNLSSHRQQC